jgi:hypothetical protein
MLQEGLGRMFSNPHTKAVDAKRGETNFERPGTPEASVLLQ